MSLSTINSKTSYILSSLTESVLSEIEKDCYDFSVKNIDIKLVDIFLIDVLYASVKYEIWVNTTYFKEVLSSFLFEKYALNKKTSESFLRKLSLKIKAIDNSEYCLRNEGNTQFSLLILISVLKNKHVENIENELGLGKKIISDISESASTDNSVFDKSNMTLKATLAKQITSISNKLIKTTWYLDIEKLNFLFSRVPQLINKYLDSHGIEWFFDKLLLIGKKKTISSNIVFEDIPQDNKIEIIEYLKFKNLIFNSNSKGDISLTKFAYQLTADKFSSSLELELSTEDFLKINPSWQSSYLENNKYSKIAINIFSKNHTVHQTVLKKIFHLLQSNISKVDLKKSLQIYALSGVTPEIRSTSYECLYSLLESSEESENLILMAKKDKSVIVTNLITSKFLCTNSKKTPYREQIEKIPRRINA